MKLYIATYNTTSEIFDNRRSAERFAKRMDKGKGPYKTVIREITTTEAGVLLDNNMATYWGKKWDCKDVQDEATMDWIAIQIKPDGYVAVHATNEEMIRNMATESLSRAFDDITPDSTTRECITAYLQMGMGGYIGPVAGALEWAQEHLIGAPLERVKALAEEMQGTASPVQRYYAVVDLDGPAYAVGNSIAEARAAAVTAGYTHQQVDSMTALEITEESYHAILAGDPDAWQRVEEGAA